VVITHESGKTAPAARPRRADARRNFERILSEARLVFAESGPEASLEEVARRAGVGIGTLYRHFPTRRALVEAVLADQIDALQQQAEALLASPAPGDAFATWLRAQMQGAMTCRGLAASAMITMLDDCGNTPPICEPMRRAGAALLERAQEAGDVRPEVDIDDLLRMVNAIGLATEDAPDAAASADRLFTLLVSGIRSG
jgi:AcrR family transcriptional regulator